MRTRIRPQRDISPIPARLACDAETRSNASAIFSLSALAEGEDIMAAVRTAILLARASRTSVSVTVLDDFVFRAAAADPVPHEVLENLLSAIRTKLFIPMPAHPSFGLVLEASITSASFLTGGAITLHVHSVDSFPQNPSSSR